MKACTVYNLLGSKMRSLLELADLDLELLQEIRLRIGKPVFIRYQSAEYTLTVKGELSEQTEKGYRITAGELRETLESVSGYSLYAFSEEMKQGYITVPGGHRVGVGGKIIMDHNSVAGIRNISCVNIRLSHQIRGCADSVMPHVVENGNLCHTLIISPPRCGKTTLLRDMIRQISDGNKWIEGQTVGLVDERSEIAGCYEGVPQNDIGIRTDVLDGCDKAEGMIMLLRSMSPQVIAVDEIGKNQDRNALESVFHCGCKLIATVHGHSVDDIKCNPLLGRMVRRHMFERYIILGFEPLGSVREIYDSRGTLLYRNPPGKDSR